MERGSRAIEARPGAGGLYEPGERDVDGPAGGLSNQSRDSHRICRNIQLKHASRPHTRNAHLNLQIPGVHLPDLRGLLWLIGHIPSGQRPLLGRRCCSSRRSCCASCQCRCHQCRRPLLHLCRCGSGPRRGGTAHACGDATAPGRWLCRHRWCRFPRWGRLCSLVRGPRAPGAQAVLQRVEDAPVHRQEPQALELGRIWERQDVRAKS
mmetsp:Transcript_108802/g.273754  ORF Transcript_108802/g.273754 Transcript_108802/m.273754 type:complete len:208 (-) Transcript_108802:569-1192(-)